VADVRIPAGPISRERFQRNHRPNGMSCIFRWLGPCPFPRGYLVDLCMAVFTLNLIDKMGTRIVLCPFLLVTAMTSHRLRVDSPSFHFQMGFHIRDIQLTTVAGVGAMDRLSEFPFTDLGMATEAFGIVNTLIAIFTSLGWQTSRPFCYFQEGWLHPGFLTLLFGCRRRCPEDSVAPTERHRDAIKMRVDLLNMASYAP